MGDHQEDDGTESERPQLAHEAILDLVRRAQAGDASAEHALYQFFTPLIRGALAPFIADSDLHEDLQGFAYLLFRRLILQFDLDRGVNLFTYLERTLPRHLWTYVRRQRELRGRRVDGE